MRGDSFFFLAVMGVDNQDETTPAWAGLINDGHCQSWSKGKRLNESLANFTLSS